MSTPDHPGNTNARCHHLSHGSQGGRKPKPSSVPGKRRKVGRMTPAKGNRFGASLGQNLGNPHKGNHPGSATRISETNDQGHQDKATPVTRPTTHCTTLFSDTDKCTIASYSRPDGRGRYRKQGYRWGRTTQTALKTGSIGIY